jgi:hypothetical protein
LPAVHLFPAHLLTIAREISTVTVYVSQMAANFHSTATAVENTVHLMPFHIDHCGPHAELESGFVPAVQCESEKAI